MQQTNNCDIACRLTSKELAERKNTVLFQLKQQVNKTTEQAEGYTFFFNSADDHLLDELIQFIKLEKECCPFFKFGLVVGEGIELVITGPAGTKAFLKEELELVAH